MPSLRLEGQFGPGGSPAGSLPGSLRSRRPDGMRRGARARLGLSRHRQRPFLLLVSESWSKTFPNAAMRREVHRRSPCPVGLPGTRRPVEDHLPLAVKHCLDAARDALEMTSHSGLGLQVSVLGGLDGAHWPSQLAVSRPRSIVGREISGYGVRVVRSPSGSWLPPLLEREPLHRPAVWELRTTLELVRRRVTRPIPEGRWRRQPASTIVALS